MFSCVFVDLTSGICLATALDIEAETGSVRGPTTEYPVKPVQVIFVDLNNNLATPYLLTSSTCSSTNNLFVSEQTEYHEADLQGCVQAQGSRPRGQSDLSMDHQSASVLGFPTCACEFSPQFTAP